MTPQEIAKKLADFYRGNPDKWVRKKLGNMTYGCCILGGALAICAEHTHYHNPLVDRFTRHFASVIHSYPAHYNDIVAVDVDAVISALDTVAAS